MRPVATSLPPDQNRDPAAERFGVGQDVRAEEHRAASIPELQNQVADLAPAQRIEPGHRLVQEHDLRVVDQRLGNADALEHPFGELSQLHPALAANAHFIEKRRQRDAGALPGRIPTDSRSRPEALRR